jgi:transglutaminase-like putative cysteine protease
VKGRLIGALPILIGVLALGNAAQAWPLAGVLVVVLGGLVLTGPRLELDPGRQMLTSAIGAGTGYVLASLCAEAEPGQLSEGWTRLAAAALMAAAARLLIVDPRGGYLTTFALMFFGLVASGETRDPRYAIFATGFLLASSWAFTWKPEHVLRSKRTRRVWLAALLWALALGIGVGSALGLRELHAWVSRREAHRYYERQAEVGFAETMDLGSLDGLLDSEKRVWRLRGPRVDYLRGTVFDRYEYGHWFRSKSAESSAKLTLSGALPAGAVVEISAVSARTRRFFLPLEAQRLVTSPASVRVDALGAIESDPGVDPLSARFVPGARERAVAAAPGPNDRQVPRRLRTRLPELAAEWTRGALTELDKLSALERHLRTEYQYSRAFTRPSGVDPIVDFLFEQKRGHCEYFATALALLARAAGIPTRVVMGYRVAEHSPFGYYVVRERNAHAWVEAWLPGEGPSGGSWSTRDATPETELPQNQAHDGGYASSLLDGLTVSYDDATRWLGNMTLAQTSVAWLFGALILSLIVARQARRKRAKPGAVPADERLLPYMQELILELAAAGHSRRPDEPLERFAARLPDALPAQLLERYAALRYGDQGDPERLALEVSACARARERAPQLPR